MGGGLVLGAVLVDAVVVVLLVEVVQGGPDPVVAHEGGRGG